MRKNRIWELDALRGLCILGMVIVHFVYDLVSLYAVVKWNYGTVFRFVMNWGGVLFLLISGVCATLGSRCVRRGLIVFGCGMLVTAVTVGMYLLGMADPAIIIYFGVLHCLGVCMLAWYFLRKLPTWVLCLLGCVMVAAGYWIQTVQAAFPFLIWLGLTTPTFATSDYFPLLPYLGFFLLGAVLGRTLYRGRQSLLPKANLQNPILRFCTVCGKHSLILYLVHQPVLSLLIMLFAKL